MQTAQCRHCLRTVTLPRADAVQWLRRHFEQEHRGQAQADRRHHAVQEAVDKELARWQRSPSLDIFGQAPKPEPRRLYPENQEPAIFELPQPEPAGAS